MNWQDIGTPTKNLLSFLDGNIKTTKSISVAVSKYMNDFTIILSLCKKLEQSKMIVVCFELI